MSATPAEVLTRCGPRYLAAHGLSAAQAKAWRAIGACRTPVLGGQQFAGDACRTTHWRWHSCRSRHCPRCQKQAPNSMLRAPVLPNEAQAPAKAAPAAECEANCARHRPVRLSWAKLLKRVGRRVRGVTGKERGRLKTRSPRKCRRMQKL